MDASLYQSLERGATVLCASQRLAHRLRLDYARQAQQAGKKVWATPAILTFNNYLIDMFRQQRQVLASIPQLLNELQTQWVWESIVTRNDSHQLLSPAQAARNALRSWQLLHQHQIPLQKLAEYGEEAQVFHGWAQAFIKHAQAHNVLDTARLISWIEHSKLVPQSSIHLAGFDQLTPAQHSLITCWERQGCEIHAHTSLDNNRSISVIALSDADDELQMAARWARAHMEQGKQRIGVVVANLHVNAAQVRRIFSGVLAPASRSTLHEYSAMLNLSSSAALSSYPLVHHALLCLQLLLDKGDVLAWGQLLRSPFMAGHESEMTARAMLDLQLRELQRDQWNADEVSRSSLTSCPVFSSAVRLAMTSLSEFPDTALPSHWTICFNRLLNQMGWARGRVLSSDEQQTRSKFHEVLAQLSSLDEVTDRVNRSAALQLLRSAVQQTRFAPESNDQAITVMDAESAAGMRFDALWITGLNANEWPAAADPDPFIPVELQYQYGVVSSRADLRLQTAQQKLQRLAGSAEDVVLSWPQHDKDVELRASSLLNDYQSYSAGTSDVPRSTVRTLVQSLYQNKPLLETILDKQLPLHPGGAIRQGSRVFELQSRCAFKAQAELRLHAVSPEPPVLGISPLERGKLIHRVLQDVWNRLSDSQGLRSALQNEGALHAQIKQAADRVAQSLFAAVSLHQQRLIRIEVDVASSLILLLLKHEGSREDFSVLRSEEQEIFEVNGLRLRIQPDRLDRLQDGSLLLLDYKTGDNYWTKDWLDINEPGRPRAPQLPLYALAHSEKLCGIVYAILAPGITELRGLADREGIAINIKDYGGRKTGYKIPQVENWSQLLQHWRKVMDELAMQFKQGIATVNPLPGECQYCTFTSLCRVKELLRDPVTEEEGDDE